MDSSKFQVPGSVLALNQATVDILVQYARDQRLVRQPLLDRGLLEMKLGDRGRTVQHGRCLCLESPHENPVTFRLRVMKSSRDSSNGCC